MLRSYLTALPISRAPTLARTFPGISMAASTASSNAILSRLSCASSITGTGQLHVSIGGVSSEGVLEELAADVGEALIRRQFGRLAQRD